MLFKFHTEQGRFPLSDVMIPPTVTSPSPSQRSFHTSILTPPLFHPVVSDTGLCDLYVRALTYTRYRGDRISLHFLLANPKGIEKKVIETSVTRLGLHTYRSEATLNSLLLHPR